MFKDKTIFVTGAGGSIGSALCRKIATMEPKLLIMFELNEYALYKVDQEVTCNKLAVLGDVKDMSRLQEFMDGVDHIFHCAAYKHVPMCEGINYFESHRNNVLGTVRVMQVGNKCESIVLLSTDKAINPAGAMGRQKKCAEEHAQEFCRTIVRLGNILESSGSVIPKFRDQIAAGGPVTVTHPDTTRYFIPMDKAVDFILLAAFKVPDTYMIDMGEPKKILDIAKEMIGDKDIEIVFTGLRPGEKLHEDIAE